MLNGNISYNFISKGKTVPFLLAGYGLANTVPLFNIPLIRTDFTVGVLNLGFGIKSFLKDDIAIRVEYRFQKFSGQKETTDSYYSYSQKVDTRIHTVQFGISILL
jgi:opacity protein-like surface antigen